MTATQSNPDPAIASRLDPGTTGAGSLSRIASAMRLPIYTSTPGLDRYPERERFAVYRATHQRLMSEDTKYRRRCNSYAAGIVCIAVVPGVFLGGGALGILLSVISISAVVVGPIFLVFRQQKFMNQRIGDALQRQEA